MELNEQVPKYRKDLIYLSGTFGRITPLLLKPLEIKMAWLPALIGIVSLGTMQVHASNTAVASHPQTTRNSTCLTLKIGQTTKKVVSSRPACFSIQVVPQEAVQLTISQPEGEDLEIHVRSKTTERLVDGFDLGNETVTLQKPGTYRIEAGKLESKPGARTIFASLQALPFSQAAAWEEAERLATMSKRSRKMENIEKSLALWMQLGETASIARTYLLRESVLRNNDAEAARANAEKALGLCRSISDLRCAAEAANNSGLASMELGDVDQAIERWDDAAQDWGKLHDVIKLAVTHANLGILFWRSGDFNKAIFNLDFAKDGLRGKDPRGYAKALSTIGLYYQSLAEYEKSHSYLQRAIAGFAGGNSQDMIPARLNLGRTYMLEGHLAQAQLLLEQVLAEARKLSDNPATAGSLRNLGQTLWKEGNVEQARARFEEALTIDRSDGDRRGESSALHYLGLVAQRNGDLSLARSYLLQAVKIRQESGLRDDAAESLSILASLEYGDGKLDAARDYAEQALKLLESVRNQVPSPALRASFYSRKRQFFDLLVDMAMAPATPQGNIEGLLAAERGRARALMDLLADDSILKQAPEDLAKRHRNIQQRLDYLAYQLPNIPPERQEQFRQKIQQLAAEEEEVEAQIRSTVAGHKLGQPLASLEEIQRDCLPPNSALLEFHLGARRSYLWLVDGQQVRSYLLPPAQTIEAEARPVVQDFGQLLERRRSPARQAEFERRLKELSTTLFGGLSGVQLPQLLILVPDGILHSVPFAALKPPGASTALGLDHDLVQVPSAAYLTFGRQPRPLEQFPRAILAMIDPVFSSSDPRVPPDRSKSSAAGTGIPLARLPFNFEIETIQSLIPANRRMILRGFDANRAKLNTLNLSDFGILHFSTHALIDDRIPELSTITLSMVNRAGYAMDGTLHPDQLARLHLDGSIVVLSACNTALGKQVLGEGLVGLTSSLFYAGGAQLVLTLTEIDAEGSSQFLSEVYRRFLPGTNSMEHSITLARRVLARDPQFSDPYYWASFIVIGRPAGKRDMTAYHTE